MAETDKLFKEKTGHGVPTTFSIFGYLLLWAIKDVGKMFAFFKDTGYAADIPALRKMNPNLISLSKWLDMQKEKKENIGIILVVEMKAPVLFHSMDIPGLNSRHSYKIYNDAIL